MTSPNDINSAVNYYKELLLYQYQNQVKATETIDLLVRAVISELVPLDIMNAFDIETAVGKQLDILGKYIGLSRRVAITPTKPFWTLADYTTYNPSVPVEGLTDYVDRTINSDSVFYVYSFANESFSDLTDFQYRQMLKLKITLNNSDNTLMTISSILWSFFNGGMVVYDTKDMFLSYAITDDQSSIAVLAFQLGLVPKPQGVGVSGIFKYFGNVFGYADYTQNNGNVLGYADYLTGWNGMHWFQYSDKII